MGGHDEIEDDGGFYHRAYGLEEHETKDFYADWATTYETELVDGKGYAMPQRCDEALARHLQDLDAPIIDLGCGTGLFGARLAARGHTTIDGVDFSPEMLDRARATGVYRELESTDLNQPLTIEDGVYAAAAVVGVFSFGHVYADALDEMCRILAPGGLLVIGVNEEFVEEGSLPAKIDQLIATGLIELVEREYGDHIPASGVGGWVYVAQRSVD